MNVIQKLHQQIDELNLWEKEIVLKRNEYLKVRGSIDTNVYYITQGSLRVFIIDENEEHTIRFGYKDSFIVSLDSFITGQPSPFYMQALKKTEIRMLTKKAYMNFINGSEKTLRMWNAILEQLVVQQMEREVDLLTSSPSERLNRVLKRSPHLFQEIPSKYIASYLRMTPETISRLKKS